MSALTYLDTGEIFRADEDGFPIGDPVATLHPAALGEDVEALGTQMAAAPDLIEELEQQADGTSTIIALLVGQPGPVAASLRGMLSIQEQAARAAVARARGAA
jgi:hypothetical protein